MSNSTLMVPIHLDGLFLAEDTLAVEAFADFSRLPFTDGTKDYNPDTPNLSESVLSQPFQNRNLNLKQGMHLHWSLPDALTQGGDSGTEADFPAAPNRWLIVRTSPSKGEKRWMVESDYLHQGIDNPYHAIAYPVDISQVGNGSQPYHYMGRQLDITGTTWTEDIAANRLTKLTALGYGDPAFAAFYPNCHSVFGCYDPDITDETDLADLKYQVIGWYSDLGQDPLYEATQAGNLAQEDIKTLIKEKFAWKVTIEEDNLTLKTSCYAQLDFSQYQQGADITNPIKNEELTVSIGNTGTEALSAYLAAGSSDKIKTEETLESVLMDAQLQSKSLDLGARFQEARHTKGFNAESGGSLFEIRPSNEDTTDRGISIDLPPAMEAALDNLNQLQQQHYQKEEEIKNLQQILFTDWYKYMLCAYPPEDARDQYPDIDYVKWYIQEKRLPGLQKEANALGRLQTDLTAAHNSLDSQVTAFNASTIADSKELYLQKLDASSINVTGLTNIKNSQWVDSTPFSANCLRFNPADNDYVSLTGHQGVKALSMWVNVAMQQNDGQATLLTIDENRLIAKDGISNFWEQIAIDGMQHPTSLPFNWEDLPKDQWFHLYVVLKEPLTSSDSLTLFGENHHAQGKLASIRLFNEALTEDELFYDHNVLGHENYELKAVAAPRFWKPTEPVVLLEGDAVNPTDRHGADGRLNDDNTLDCELADLEVIPDNFNNLIQQINSYAPTTTQTKVGFNTWGKQPWHPFLLEWEVEIFPMQSSGNLNIDNRNYQEDFITDNYALAENQPEVTLRENKNTTSAAAIYRGRTILTPFAKDRMVGAIQGQFSRVGLYAKEALTTDEQKQLTEWLTELDDQAVKNWKKEDYSIWFDKRKSLLTQEGLEWFTNLLDIYQIAEDSHFLSQALSGFNNALLMQQQTLQLPVHDPIGFSDYRAFTQLVQQAIGSNANLAPLPLNDFLPIRSGTMRLHQLRLIDSFGQTREVIERDAQPASFETAEPFNLSNPVGTDVSLPPRFVQPARLNFRWLSANGGGAELNSHPESSPICGWLLANHLDNSIVAYDHNGFGIGVIDQEAHWRGIPGSDAVVHPDNIPNPALRKAIQRLVTSDAESDSQDKKDFLQAFITTTDQALENIDPESFAHHQELALLMGRPIAIVRTAINLEVKGSPAVHHGWTEFHQDLLRDGKNTDELEKVKVPVRVGERRQLNDGVLGYWKESSLADGDFVLDEVFHTTVAQDEDAQDDLIKSYERDPLNLQLSIDSPPQLLTMLFDPRAEAHVTTGVLPVKSIDIPKYQYTDALKRINMTFLSTPILMAAADTTIPLPNELGYTWSWLAKDRYEWYEAARHGTIQKSRVVRTFGDQGSDIWDQLIAKGWIKNTDPNKADVVPKDQRRQETLEAPYNQQADKIENMLAAGHIVPPDTKAAFKSSQTIKEGWLKLSQNKN